MVLKVECIQVYSSLFKFSIAMEWAKSTIKSWINLNELEKTWMKTWIVERLNIFKFIQVFSSFQHRWIGPSLEYSWINLNELEWLNAFKAFKFSIQGCFWASMESLETTLLGLKSLEWFKGWIQFKFSHSTPHSRPSSFQGCKRLSKQKTLCRFSPLAGWLFRGFYPAHLQRLSPR